jgi:hypothetical protein
MRARTVSLFLLGIAIVAFGCDSGPKIVTVSGVATYKGQPVSNLRLNFQPEKGRPSWGDTDANGRFTLEYDAQNKGALLGTHTVSARFLPGGPDEEMAAAQGKFSKGSQAARTVAEKYGDTEKSPLKVEITGPTDNLEVKFD